MEQSFFSLVEAAVPSGVEVYWGQANRDAGNPKAIIWRVGRSDDRLVSAVRGMSQTLIQIDCWGNNWLQAYDLGEALRLALDGSTNPASRIQGIFLQSIRDNEPKPDISDREAMIQLDFLVQYSEAVA